MSNPTSNYNWQMPTATDLVTDLPADFEVFGQAVDTSLADLLGGTTGQVLAKASATDMDFVWTTDAAGMTNPMTTTGDTIYSSSGSTPARLGIGTTGQVLAVSGGIPAWTTPAAGGKVLQVVNATYGTQAGSTSTTYADTGLTATITPTLATSKILVIVDQSGVGKWNANNFVFVRLNRGATALLEFSAIAAYTGTVSYNIIGGVGASYLDSPATTSATIYKTQFKSSNTDQVFVQQNGDFSSITLMEIGA
jgi:hypothetical protein